MKTKKLIELLQEADPEGEAECCIDNHDVYYVQKMEAYYDGRLELLKYSEKYPYHIIGAEVTCRGTKVKIYYKEIEDAIYDNSTLPVVIHAGNERSDKEWRQKIEEWREEAREGDRELEEYRRKEKEKKALEAKAQES